MEPSEIMAVLLDLAQEAELEVRSVRGTADIEVGGAPPGSAVCRVRGAVWVMLSGADPVAIQLAVLAEALCKEAPELVDQKFLPPAVRALLDDAVRS